VFGVFPHTFLATAFQRISVWLHAARVGTLPNPPPTRCPRAITFADARQLPALCPGRGACRLHDHSDGRAAGRLPPSPATPALTGTRAAVAGLDGQPHRRGTGCACEQLPCLAHYAPLPEHAHSAAQNDATCPTPPRLQHTLRLPPPPGMDRSGVLPCACAWRTAWRLPFHLPYVVTLRGGKGGLDENILDRACYRHASRGHEHWTLGAADTHDAYYDIFSSSVVAKGLL